LRFSQNQTLNLFNQSHSQLKKSIYINQCHLTFKSQGRKNTPAIPLSKQKYIVEKKDNRVYYG